MATTFGSNMSGHNTSFLWEAFFRKLGMKPKTITCGKTPSRRYAGADDDGTTFPRQIMIMAKYSATTAPTTNTAADAPTGIGDICIYFAANTPVSNHVAVASIDIYRCSAYTNSTTFTWSKIVD